MVGTIILPAIFLAFPFCRFAFERDVLGIVATVVLAFILPFFTAIIGVSFAMVINDKIILVKTASNDLLVTVLVNFVVDGTLVLDLIRFQT